VVSGIAAANAVDAGGSSAMEDDGSSEGGGGTKGAFG
jgi:hypothetical protein